MFQFAGKKIFMQYSLLAVRPLESENCEIRPHSSNVSLVCAGGKTLCKLQ